MLPPGGPHALIINCCALIIGRLRSNLIGGGGATTGRLVKSHMLPQKIEKSDSFKFEF